MFLMTVCIITTIIIIILIISIKELVTRNNSYQQQHSTYVRNDSWLNNEDLVQSSSSCDSDEVRESRIQKSDLLDLRRSISAVLLYNQNKSCRRSNSTTFKNVILAKEEEFLCWINNSQISFSLWFSIEYIEKNIAIYYIQQHYLDNGLSRCWFDVCTLHCIVGYFLYCV